MVQKIDPMRLSNPAFDYTELGRLWRSFPHEMLRYRDDRGLCWIAGGAVRRTFAQELLTGDVDLFFPTRNAFNAWRSALVTKGARVTAERDYLVQFDYPMERQTYKIQTICGKFFATVEELLEDFDFTICQFAYDGNCFYVGDHALFDLNEKRIVSVNRSCPTSTLRRMFKYHAQGFRADDVELRTFLRAVAREPASIEVVPVVGESDVLPPDKRDEKFPKIFRVETAGCVGL